MKGLVPYPSAQQLAPRRDCVVELVGLEPTTRVLWNTGVFDQLTSSNTRHSSKKMVGHFYKRKLSFFARKCSVPPRQQPSSGRKKYDLSPLLTLQMRSQIDR